MKKRLLEHSNTSEFLRSIVKSENEVFILGQELRILKSEEEIEKFKKRLIFHLKLYDN